MKLKYILSGIIFVGAFGFSVLASAQNTLEITTPRELAYVNTLNRQHFPVAGNCVNGGSSVRITSPVEATLTCTNSRFSSEIDLRSVSRIAFPLNAEQTIPPSPTGSGSTILQDSVFLLVDITPPTLNLVNGSSYWADILTESAHPIWVVCSEVGYPLKLSIGSQILYDGICQQNAGYSIAVDLSSFPNDMLTIEAEHWDYAGNSRLRSFNLGKQSGLGNVADDFALDQAGNSYFTTVAASGRPLLICKNPDLSLRGMLQYAATRANTARVAVSPDGAYLSVLTPAGIQKVQSGCTALGSFISLPSSYTSSQQFKQASDGKFYLIQDVSVSQGSPASFAKLLRLGTYGNLISQATLDPEICDSLVSSAVVKTAKFQINPETGKAFAACISDRYYAYDGSHRFSYSVAPVSTDLTTVGELQAGDTFVAATYAHQMSINDVGDLLFSYDLIWDGVFYTQSKSLKNGVWSARSNLLTYSEGHLVIPDGNSFVVVAKSTTQSVPTCGSTTTFPILKYARAVAASQAGAAVGVSATAEENSGVGQCRLNVEGLRGRELTLMKLDANGNSYDLVADFPVSYQQTLAKNPNVNAAIESLLHLD